MPNTQRGSCPITAARILQDMKAEMLGIPALRYNHLSVEQQQDLITNVQLYIESEQKIDCAKSLHGFNCLLLLDNGWTASNRYSLEDKESPMLLDFDCLPVFIQTFIRCSLVVLQNLTGETK